MVSPAINPDGGLREHLGVPAGGGPPPPALVTFMGLLVHILLSPVLDGGVRLISTSYVPVGTLVMDTEVGVPEMLGVYTA